MEALSKSIGPTVVDNGKSNWLGRLRHRLIDFPRQAHASINKTEELLAGRESSVVDASWAIFLKSANSALDIDAVHGILRLLSECYGWRSSKFIPEDCLHPVVGFGYDLASVDFFQMLESFLGIKLDDKVFHRSTSDMSVGDLVLSMRRMPIMPIRKSAPQPGSPQP